MSGLLYELSGCSRIEQTLIDEFHPVMFGKFDTLNWLAMLSLRVRKHALLMLMKERW